LLCITLRAGAHWSFEVSVDGVMLHSKLNTPGQN
jgi:hypothetical protein